jgi:hypothetical protein
MSLRKICFPFMAGLILSSTFVLGQAARSPFSSYGIGEQYVPGLTQNMGMGGTGISNPSYYYANVLNPALLPYNLRTTFHAGIIGEQRTQSSATITEKSGSGNLNYLVLVIPIKPGKWTSSLSMMPYTRLNYQLKYAAPIKGSPTDSVIVTELGSGGVNQVNWSNGYAINKSIALGLKATYLFSATVSEYSNSLAISSFVVSNPHVYERTSVSGFQFSPAIAIHIDSLTRKNYILNLGAVYDLGTTVNAKFFQRLDRIGSTGLPIDSLTLISNQPGKITLPQSFAVGISVSSPNKWVAAVDGSYTDYSSYKGLDGKNPYASTDWRVAAGFEFIPDRQSLTSYLKRTTYRTGVSLENYPYLANGNTVRDFGITFGISLPVNGLSSLDVALKVGKKGDKTLNSIEENYLKLYFAITFMDQWFIKRKFD